VVFFDDLLIPNPGYLIITTSKAPEHGGLLAGALMDHQIIGDLSKMWLWRDRCFDSIQRKHLLAKGERIEPDL
jgi:hypothetical protein